MDEIKWLLGMLQKEMRVKKIVIIMVFIVATILTQFFLGGAEAFLLITTNFVMIMNRTYVNAISSNNSMMLLALYRDRGRLVTSIYQCIYAYLWKFMVLLYVEVVVYQLIFVREKGMELIIVFLGNLVTCYILCLLLWLHTYVSLFKSKIETRFEVLVLLIVMMVCQVSLYIPWCIYLCDMVGFIGLSIVKYRINKKTKI